MPLHTAFGASRLAAACAVPLLLAVPAAKAPAAGREGVSEIESVSAFARLYGVVRYFYPSDAASELDWQGFARLGVARARGAGRLRSARDARLAVRAARTRHRGGAGAAGRRWPGP
jgi:hypothetical protein